MSISNLVTKTIGFVTVAITIVVTKKRKKERWLQKEREKERWLQKQNGYKKNGYKKEFPPRRLFSLSYASLRRSLLPSGGGTLIRCFLLTVLPTHLLACSECYAGGRAFLFLH